ncbi:hypothetical protein L1987_39431 [Smallanthus sonchifolius]|uniref:Uncharacterized protein n=1 Tax=Smallanthus sonchifolius TaxID=185202 RepID=A0ACB9HLC8_9ASTR|nr:hypothetical protein L1987_39431 [Smallanthus sonchifolius]
MPSLIHGIAIRDHKLKSFNNLIPKNVRLALFNVTVIYKLYNKLIVGKRAVKTKDTNLIFDVKSKCHTVGEFTCSVFTCICRHYKNSSFQMSIILLIVSSLLFFEVTDVQAQTGYLPQDEVNALRAIAEELGKRDWNFTLNPCGNNYNWATPNESVMDLYKNIVQYNCSGNVCHVKAITLQGQDLDGVLPPSLAKLPYIKTIDLARNYLNGTIPPEWASTKLEFLSVCVNRLSGRIPTYLGNISSLVYLSLESNMFSGTVPGELGKLVNLVNLILNANNLSGELPMELNNLANLTDLRLTSNNFNGRIPSLESWKQLRKLEIHGSGLEGPIPASISLLSNLEELRISDISGESSLFPNLSSMINMTRLVLRSCNITGRIPDYISHMSNLKHLDLSFNDIVGSIPDLSGLRDLQNMYVTGNSLNGSVPRWLTNKVIAVDLSYNNFSEESVPSYCGGSLNLFRSYTVWNDSNYFTKCLSPCSKEYNSVHINCGGIGATIGDKVYEADENQGGLSKFRQASEHWGFSSTGNVLDVDAYQYKVKNVSSLTMKDFELYTVARLSPHSITYYGRCLANGRYRVTLHFADIVFRDNKSYHSLGRRAFDVYVQGAIKLKSFDIKNEARGVDKAVIRKIKNIHVTNKTLEIRFQYSGNGTTVVPSPGIFGPLISAISMESETKPGKTSTFVVIGGAVIAALCLTLIVVGIAWRRGYIRDKISREKDLRGLDLQTGTVFTYRQIKAATENFADSNKLGEGGFGSVYKAIAIFKEAFDLTQHHILAQFKPISGSTCTSPRGYMAPEYVLRGHLTYKADVYSFGVLLLEIVAGKNNMKYDQSEEFICLADRSPALRPTMSEVLNMLECRIKPDINLITSDDEFKLQELKLKLEEIQSLDIDEQEIMNALKEIAKQLGKEDWNFSLNPCDENPNWSTPGFQNAVNCTCSPDACHVVNISLMRQDLAGVLPPSLAKLPSIKMMSLENNLFSGKVPAELGNLKKLLLLILTANNLTGELPMELNSLTNLTQLRLDSNNFSGKIPNLGNCTRLQMFLLSGVNILKDFDIKNEAGGGVDKAVIKTSKCVVTNGTLEIRFQYAGKALFLTLTFVGVAWKKGYIGNQISRERGMDLKTRVFTYKQIKAATYNFAESNKLGEGGFGSVYKGEQLDGTIIAVKQLSSTSKQGNREFVNEKGMIAGIKHDYMGVVGYMAPEYALWGYLTYKADVYSFGVLALEIVAGKNNMKYRPNDDYVSLLDLAVVLKEKGSLTDLLDPT